MMDVTNLRHDGGWSDRDGVIYQPVTLTDAEREAIEGAIVAEHQRGAWQWAATLRSLLDRLGGERDRP